MMGGIVHARTEVHMSGRVKRLVRRLSILIVGATWLGCAQPILAPSADDDPVCYWFENQWYCT
jgi:hypothetical protein